MKRVLAEQTMDTESFAAAFQEGAGKWTGCDWPTHFGRTGPNLNGLKASQVLILARATAGTEASDWRAAVAWLTRVERDAGLAEEAAAKALNHAQHGMLTEAAREAQRACAIEAKYHSHLVWQPLREAIERALNEAAVHHDDIRQRGRQQR